MPERSALASAWATTVSVAKGEARSKPTTPRPASAGHDRRAERPSQWFQKWTVLGGGLGNRRWCVCIEGVAAFRRVCPRPGVVMTMRRLVSRCVLVGIVAFVLAGCGDATAPSDGRSSSALPAGWRWESYGGVEVGVPAGWGYAVRSVDWLTSRWRCTDRDQPADYEVARLRAQVLATTCLRGDPLNPDPLPDPDPATLISNTGTFVVFGDRTVAETQREGDRTTVTINGISLAVQALPRLREQIVATIHAVAVDSNGCPATHPISTAPEMTPDPAVAVGTLTAVTAVAACHYAVLAGVNAGANGPQLLSSLRLTAGAAQAAINGIAQAPRGGGPNAPSTCAVDYSYGDDLIVLSVTSGQTRNEIYLRYSGCDHNGFDDGTGIRSLTAKVVAPFIAEPNAILGFSGPASKIKILHPEANGTW
jgi:hypothetical protein